LKGFGAGDLGPITAKKHTVALSRRTRIRSSTQAFGAWTESTLGTQRTTFESINLGELESLSEH